MKLSRRQAVIIIALESVGRTSGQAQGTPGSTHGVALSILNNKKIYEMLGSWEDSDKAVVAINQLKRKVPRLVAGNSWRGTYYVLKACREAARELAKEFDIDLSMSADDLRKKISPLWRECVENPRVGSHYVELN